MKIKSVTKNTSNEHGLPDGEYLDRGFIVDKGKILYVTGELAKPKYIKIYVNDNNEIMSIGTPSKEGLKELTVDRAIFGDKSDFVILNYCCIEANNGFIIYPRIDLFDILRGEYEQKFNEVYEKTKILEKENAQIQYALMMGGLI